MRIIYPNKLFLIGNGFDLNNGLRSSYKDFIMWYILTTVETAFKNGQWEVDDDCFKIEINHNYRRTHWASYALDFFDQARLANNFSVFFFDNQYNNSDLNKQCIFNICPKNNFIRDLLSECLDSDWSGIEDGIQRFIKKCHYNVQNDNKTVSINRLDSQVYTDELKNIQSLNASVKQLKDKLTEYLTRYNEPKKMNTNMFSENMGWDYYLGDGDPLTIQTRKVMFLNFNYTTYYTEMIDRIVKECNDESIVFDNVSIHGNLDSSLDDIVFGVGDEQNDFYDLIESLYSDEWLYCMKSFHYFRNESYQKLLGFIKGGDYEIYILGHSCSITDRTLLNMLFENKYCKKIHVFHHEGIKSYLKTTYNIARNFKDKVKMREVVQPFNSDLTM